MTGKTTTTTGPSRAALPNLNAATGALNSAYGQSSALANSAVGTLQDNLPTVLASTINNPNLSAASGYNSDVLGGKYLTGNPFLDAQIANTNSDVTNTVNGAIGSRGLAGGSAQAQILARELAKNESNLRYTDYNNERTRMDNAVGQAASLSGANNSNIATLLAYLTGTAQLPISVASPYASGIGGLWGDSKTTTQTSSPGILGVLGAGLDLASSAKSLGLFSDRRLKRDIRREGTTADGLGVYVYRYQWGGPLYRGVMADEVAVERPWALLRDPSGFAKVDYAAL